MAVTSQLARNLNTLLGQMKDQARGERIKALRINNPALSQPKIVDGVNDLGGPGTIGLRGYQYWESTGGIDYDKAVLLATFHGVDPDWLYYGPDGKPGTPDLAAMLNGDREAQRTEIGVEVLTRLERIEQKLDQLLGGATQAPEPPPADASDVADDPQLDQDSRQDTQDEDEPETGEEER